MAKTALAVVGIVAALLMATARDIAAQAPGDSVWCAGPSPVAGCEVLPVSRNALEPVLPVVPMDDGNGDDGDDGQEGDADPSDDQTDDTEPATLSIAGPEEPVVEGDTAEFTVTLSHQLPSEVTVAWVAGEDEEDNATAGEDYTPELETVVLSDDATYSDVVTFPAGEVTQIVAILIVDDDRSEPDESFTVTLGEITGDGSESVAEPPDPETAAATVIIEESDPLTVRLAGDAIVSEGGGATYTISIEGGIPGSELTVDYATADDMATAGEDYAETSGTLTFAIDDAETQTVTVSTLTDDAVEGDESFTFTLSNLAGGGGSVALADSPVATTIADATAAARPVVSIAGPAEPVVEGGDVVFTLTADPAPDVAQTVTVTVSGGGDYGVADGTHTVTFAANATTATLTLTTDDDDVVDAEGSITATVATGDWYDLSADATARAVVQDNDAVTRPVVSIAGPAEPVVEGGDVAFTLTADPAPDETQTVTVAVSGGADYGVADAEHTVTFEANAVTATLTLTTDDDDVVDAEGNITATVGTGDWYDLSADATAQAVVQDNDATARPVVSIAGPAEPVVEGGDVAFTLTADPAPDVAQTVTVSVSGGADYGVADAEHTVTFAANATTATLTLATDDDDVVDAEGSITATVATGDWYDLSADATAQAVVQDNDATARPVVSIAGPTQPVVEGGDVVFTLTVDPAPDVVQTVTVAVSGGADYGVADADHTVTFAANGTTATLTLATDDDDVAEAEGTIMATVSAGDWHDLSSDASAQAVVQDNDEAAQPVVSIAGPTQPVVEGGDVVFTLTVDPAPDEAQTVTVTVSGGADYGVADAEHTVTFAANGTTATLTLTTVDDKAEVEEEATLTATLQPGDGYTPDPNGSTAWAILLDKTAPRQARQPLATLSIAASSASVAEGRSVGFTVSLTQTVNAPFTARWNTGGTAERADYTVDVRPADVNFNATANVGTVAFAAGDSSKTIAVEITDDTLSEQQETITLTLGLLTGSGANLVTLGTSTATATIAQSDEAQVALEGPSDDVTEGGQDPVFTVRLEGGDLTNAVLIDYATADGKAEAPGDYTAASGTLTFTHDGPTSQTVTVTIADDDFTEVDETFTFGLSNLRTSGGEWVTLPSGPATATIAENDQITIALEGSDSVNEGESASYTVSIEGGRPASDLTVDYATADGAAESPDDYTAESGTLTFTSLNYDPHVVSVSTVNDDAVEGNESFTFSLTNPAGGGGPTPILKSPSSATTTIVNADSGKITITGPDAAVEEGSPVVFTITVEQAPTVEQTATVSVSGGAVYGVPDQTHTVTFTAGRNSARLVLTTTEDDAIQGTATITAQLSPGDWYTVDVNNNTATATVTDSTDLTLIVNNTGDGTDDNPGDSVCNNGNGFCTLRAAIEEANAYTDGDLVTINFAIAGAGPHTIQPDSPLPDITRRIIIDGFSQSGSSYASYNRGATLKIELDGSNANGLTITGDNSDIIALVINRFGRAGIELKSGATGNRILGNHIGTDAAGDADLGNLYGVIVNQSNGNFIGLHNNPSRNVISGNDTGIWIDRSDNTEVVGNYVGPGAAGVDVPTRQASDSLNSRKGILITGGSSNIIGGVRPFSRNVIAGSNTNVELESGATGNLIQGNYIGTNAAGTAAPGGTTATENLIGVRVRGAGSSGNVIGGTVTEARNVISANDTAGISLTESSTSTRIEGNYIGTTADGAAALANGDGVSVVDSGGNTIGGSEAGARNVISGNRTTGIIIAWANRQTQIAANDNLIQGNYIGQKATLSDTAADALGNGSHGVLIRRDASNNRVLQNAIVYNRGDGVRVESGSGNRISRNEFHSNRGLGIDLGGDGITENDADGFDDDTGANGLQNFPRLQLTQGGSQQFVVTVYFNGASSATFDVELYQSHTCEYDYRRQGQTFLLSQRINTDGSGRAGLVHRVSADEINEYITAVAIAANGDTSEFSECLKLEYIVGITGPADPVTEGDDVVFEARITPAPPTGIILTAEVSGGAGVGVDDGNIDMSIGAGQVIRSVTLTTVDDDTPEAQSTITATLLGGIEGFVLDSERSSATAVVLDNDGVVFTVNSTGTGGDTNRGDGVCATTDSTCTLYAALGEAALTHQEVNIHFNIPQTGSPTHRITIGFDGPLPWISGARNITIDGYTQPGASPATDSTPATVIIQLDGSPLTGRVDGLRLRNVWRPTIIRGLAIKGFRDGISLNNSTNVRIEGNIIGDATHPNLQRGIFLTDSDNNVIGGNTPAQRNVIAGNTGNGIRMEAGSTGNRVKGNYIGIYGDGATVGSQQRGVALVGGSNNNVIGGTALADRNIITGAAGTLAGVTIHGSNGNRVENNYIGTAVSGLSKLGGLTNGVTLSGGSSGNVIGGAAAARNVISGAVGDGVFINVARDNVIQGNYIGIGAGNRGDVGNGAHGVNIQSGSGTRVESNTIAHNALDGVWLRSGTGNVFTRNVFHSNGGLAIDLKEGSSDTGGVTANDAGDADSGANHRQNFPTLQLEAVTTTSYRVAVSLDTRPNRSVKVELYSNPACDPSGHGEGRNWLYTRDVNTDANGAATFTQSFSKTDNTPLFITAIATDSGDGTSEFSACLSVESDPTITVTHNNDVRGDTDTSDYVCDAGRGLVGLLRIVDLGCNLRAAIEQANARTGEQPIRIHFNLPGTGPHKITLNNELPAITRPIIIDGYTQPDASAATATSPAVIMVELSGESTTGANGLTIGTGGDGSAIRGLAINRFDIGIRVESDNSRIEGNYIGVNPAGDTARANQLDGIRLVGASNNVIGGRTPAARNVVSGNSARDRSGIHLTDDSNGNRIEGNYIGLSADGSGAIPNYYGVDVRNSDNNVIGGSDTARNVISGNDHDGVLLFREALNNTVEGNYIGVNPAGDAALPNGRHGVHISGHFEELPNDNTVRSNLIAHNLQDGVRVTSGLRNHITANRIHSNGGLGIDLGGDGITANDYQDVDHGPNNKRNYPILESRVGSRTVFTLATIIRGKPDTTFTVEFFKSDACDTSGHGEGWELAHTETGVTTDADGYASFERTFPLTDRGKFITAVAIGPRNNTSEFSACRQLLTVAGISGPDAPVTEGNNLLFTITLAPPPAEAIFMNYSASGGEDFGVANKEFSTEIYAGVNTFTSSLSTVNSPTPHPSAVVTATLRPGTGYEVDPTRDTATATVQDSDAETLALRVNSTGDQPDDNPGDKLCAIAGADNTCTLRAAIQEANAATSAAVVVSIGFAIPGNGPHTISPGSPLPALTRSVTIDGYTQPGARAARGQGVIASERATIKIELEGSSAGETAAGLHVTGGSSTIRGLAINRFRYGIRLHNTDGNRIEGNYLGVNTGGDTGRTNAFGIHVDNSDGNTIGGPRVAQRNVISGNVGINRHGGYGVWITHSDNNDVRNNHIGTDAGGSRKLGNDVGLAVASSDGNRIRNNIISGNVGLGVIVWGILYSTSDGNVISNNRIGVAHDGETALGNGRAGIKLDSRTAPGQVTNTVIGRNADGSGDGNIISRNNHEGIFVSDATGSLIKGNTISHNRRDGVWVSHRALQNRITRNSIHDNGDLGIDLQEDEADTDGGVTPNDAGDTDSGGNNLQNFPTLSLVRSAGHAFTVSAAFNGAADSTFSVEFYHSPACGNGEGKSYAGSQVFNTGSSGDGQVEHTIRWPSDNPSPHVTAIIIADNGDTSEFSACLAIGRAPLTTVSITSPTTVPEGTGIEFTVTADPAPTGNLTVTAGISGGTGYGVSNADRTVTLTPSAPSATFTVDTTDDDIGRAPANVTATLRSGDGFGVHTETYYATTIVHDDDGLVLTVNSTGDESDARHGDGICAIVGDADTCTLRAAIEEANRLSPLTKVKIHFDIGDDPSAVHTIRPVTQAPAVGDANRECREQYGHVRFRTAAGTGTLPDGTSQQHYCIATSRLPEIAKGYVTIDGYTQPGASAATATSAAVIKIELVDGTGITGEQEPSGLVVIAPQATIRGLAIGEFEAGILLTGIDLDVVGTNAAEAVIEGNYIGLDATGEIPRGNATGILMHQSGARVLSENHLIGGRTPAARNVISGNLRAGIDIDSTGTRVEGNYIGTNASGTRAVANGVGVSIFLGSHNVIGGTAPGAGNLISGNNLPNPPFVHNPYIPGFDPALDGFQLDEESLGGVGVFIDNQQSSNRVEGNYIGTNPAGDGVGDTSQAWPASRDQRVNDRLGNSVGVVLLTTDGQTVGGTTAAARNVISGSRYDGVLVISRYFHAFGNARAHSSLNRVQGNYIGTNAAGTAALPNGRDGVRLDDGQLGRIPIDPDADPPLYRDIRRTNVGVNDNVIGGSAEGAGNLIAGNGRDGVRIETADRTVVEGNRIGVKTDGTALPNAGHGVHSAVDGSDSVVRGNTIANNTGDGVRIAATSTANRITANSIHDNDGLGIDLLEDADDTGGVTVNDAATDTEDADADSGANNLQNFPALTLVDDTPEAYRVHAVIDGAPETTYSIEVYRVAEADPGGHGEGHTLLATLEATTNTNGRGDVLSANLPRDPPGEEYKITAIAIAPNGDTSEFSRYAERVTVSITGPNAPVTEGDYVVFTLTPSPITPQTLPVTVEMSGGAAFGIADGNVPLTRAQVHYRQASSALTLSTDDDKVHEPNATITATLRDSRFYIVDSDRNTATAQILDNDAPADLTLEATPDRIGEGDGLTRVTVTATLEGGVRTEATEITLFRSGTATPGANGDYTFSELVSINIPANQQSAGAVFYIAPVNDNLVEGDETILITAVPPVDLNAATETLTITDDDDATVSIAGPTDKVQEGTDAVFTVSLSNPVASATSVLWQSAPGTADRGPNGDFLQELGTVEFSAGSNADQTIRIPTRDDTLSEPDEIFSVVLALLHTNPQSDRITMNTTEATATIAESDGLTVAVSGPETVAEGSNATYTVSISGGVPTADLTVDYATANGTATAPGDYAHATGTLTFIAEDFDSEDDAAQTVEVSIETDNLVEGTEDFTFTLSNVRGGGGPAPTLGTSSVTTDITSADAVEGFTLEADPDWIREIAGQKDVTVKAELEGAVRTEDTVVTLAIDATSTAEDPGDYAMTGLQNITIQPGQDSATITLKVTPVNDNKLEGEEAIVLTGTLPAALSLDPARATITFGDEHWPPGLLPDPNQLLPDVTPATSTMSITGPASSVTEGSDAVFTIELSHPVASEIIVGWSVSGGTAATNDYTLPAVQTVTFAAEETSKTVSIGIDQDSRSEPEETLIITLGQATGDLSDAVTGDGATATATIAESDGLTVAVSGPETVAEGSNATYTVSISGGTPTADLTVDYAVTAGTATADDDYTVADDAPASPLTFTATDHGAKTIIVAAAADNLVEGKENFTFTLSNVRGGGATPTLGTSSVATDITDDDTVTGLTLEVSPTSIAENAGAAERVTVTATLTGGGIRTEATVVTLSLADTSTATSGTDYADLGTLTDITIPATQTRGEVALDITPVNDEVVEGDETIIITGTAQGLSLDAATATVTLADDDTATLSITGPAAAVDEGDPAEFTVTLSPAVAAAVTVAYATADGTATAGSDYTAAAADSKVTFAANSAAEATQTFSIATLTDNVVEGEEQFTVNLGTVSAGPAGLVTVATDGGSATARIADDDALAGLTLTASPDSIAEGDDATRVTLTAALGGEDDPVRPVPTEVTLAVSTASTAANPADYAMTALAASITIPATQSSATTTVDITPVDDNLLEGDETIAITATPTAPVAGLSAATAEITLQDGKQQGNPITATVSIAGPNAAVTEGSSAEFDIELSVPVAADITVAWSVSGGDSNPASAGDYEIPAEDHEVIFTAGATARTVTVNAVDDNLSEPAETFKVTLGAITGRLSDLVSVKTDAGSATATIAASDPITVRVSGPDAAVNEGSPATYTVSISGGDPTANLTVDYATGHEDDTAVAPDDYAAASGTLTFTADDYADKTVQVQIEDDNVVEGDETFLFTINNPVGGGGTTSLAANPSVETTITDDDALAGLTLTASHESIAEGDNATVVTLTATLSGNVVRTERTAVTLSWDEDADTGGTATRGDAATEEYPTDYAAPATLSPIEIPAGGSSASTTVTITPLSDAVVEGDETIVVVGEPPAGVSGLSAARATITLQDDEPNGAILSITGPTGAVAEDSEATFTLSLSPAVASPLTVAWSTGDTADTATAGDDYTAVTTGSVTFTANDTQETIAVTTLEDDLSELAETFTVTLGTVTGDLSALVSVPTPTATATIAASDAITVRLTGPDTVNEGDAATYTISLRDGTPTANLMVDYTVTAGTATAGDDYAVAASGTLTFTATDYVDKTITVTAVDDDLVEGKEDFTFTLSNVRGGGGPTPTLESPSEIDTDIADNDAATLSISRPSGSGPVAEGSDAEFTVTLSHAVASGVAVDWSTGDPTDTATAGADYTSSDPTTAQVDFPANSAAGATRTITVNTANDNVVEEDETFTVRLGTVTAGGDANVTVDVGTATATITSDDALTGINLIADPSSISEADGDTTVDFKARWRNNVRRAEETTVALEVDAASTAEDPDDYTMTGLANITITAGEPSGTVTPTITPVDDGAGDDGETIVVKGTLPNTLGLPPAQTSATATITITEGPPVVGAVTPELSITGPDSPVIEGQLAQFEVTLSAPVASDITVAYFAGHRDDTDTARSGHDYTAPAGNASVTFAANSASGATQSIVVNTIDDEFSELDETFTINLGSITGAQADQVLVDPDSATATIAANDRPTVHLTGDTSVREGDVATYTVSISDGIPTKDLSVDYETADETAISGEDYRSMRGTLTFIPTNYAAKTIEVETIDDDERESSERYTFDLTAARGGGGPEPNLQSSVTTIINDNEPRPVAPQPVAPPQQPSPSPTVTPAPTPSPTVTPAPTPSPTPTPTPTPTPSPTPTPAVSVTPTPSATPTPTVSATPTPSPTPTPTVSATPTPTVSATPTPSPTPTPTVSATPTPSPTPTAVRRVGGGGGGGGGGGAVLRRPATPTPPTVVASPSPQVTPTLAPTPAAESDGSATGARATPTPAPVAALPAVPTATVRPTVTATLPPTPTATVTATARPVPTVVAPTPTPSPTPTPAAPAAQVRPTASPSPIPTPTVQAPAGQPVTPDELGLSRLWWLLLLLLLLLLAYLIWRWWRRRQQRRRQG